MKLLSVVVPCYNSQEYMERCIDSLLVGKELLEIIIVNDGSSDKTESIAMRYSLLHPYTIKVINKTNGGHGDAINAGLNAATGTFFKVVDSDDWLDRSALIEILDSLEHLRQGCQIPDMVVSNYVYEKEIEDKRTVIDYQGVFPENCLLTWEFVGKMKKGRYVLMHSVIFSRELLIQCDLRLPKHTFYVDNLYVYIPMFHVKTIYYINVNLYRYYIGREDQSVNEKVMINRIDQQLKVNRMMLEETDFSSIEDRNKRQFIMSYLKIITVVSSVLLLKSGNEENYVKKKELWRAIKDNDRNIFWNIRMSILGILVNLPGRMGRRVTLWIYGIARRHVGFN